MLCRNLKLENDFNFALLARLTPGYVGADLMSLCREATMSVLDRILGTILYKEENSNQESACLNGKIHESDIKENPTLDTVAMRDLTYDDYLQSLRRDTLFSESDLETVCIEVADFKNALPSVQPSAKREGFATVPDVTWEDIGALESIRAELTMAILVCRNVVGRSLWRISVRRHTF